MNYSSNTLTAKKIRKAEELIGYSFKDKNLIRAALTHASSLQAETNGNYERLEWVGDRFVNAILAQEIAERFPLTSIGECNDMYQHIISNQRLTKIGIGKGINSLIIKQSSNGKKLPLKDKDIADVVESITAALIMDGGYYAARKFILDIFRSSLNKIDKNLRVVNPVAALNKYTEDHNLNKPTYAFKQACSVYDVPIIATVSIDGFQPQQAGDITKQRAKTRAARLLSHIVFR